MPDVPPLPANEKVTAWLNQPFESGARAGVAWLTVGAVLSSFTVTVYSPDSPLLVAQQVMLVPGVSVVSVRVSQLLEAVSPETCQCTVTLLVYQPLLPSVPVSSGEMDGGDAAAALHPDPGRTSEAAARDATRAA